MHYCYILKSVKSSKYYIGATDNLKERLLQHNLGRNRSTKKDKPWKLYYSEDFTDLRSARKRELQIKHWKSRVAIEKLYKSRILDFVKRPSR